MSCITKILEIKGDKPFLIAKEPYNKIAVESGGVYKGYEYLVTLNTTGIRCGYVAIDHTHPLYNIPKDKYDDNELYELDVHGGVTFFDMHGFSEAIIGYKCTDKWIGFDCGHAGDKFDLETAKTYFQQGATDVFMMVCKQIEIHLEVRNQMVKEFGNSYQEDPDYECVRSVAYATNQCRKVIQQLIKKEAA